MEDISFEARMAIHEPNQAQLYSAPTANGLKAAAVLEEIRDLVQGDGVEFDYEAHLIDIRHGEQQSELNPNPNRKIPSIVIPTEDHSAVKVWESGSILLCLAKKYDVLIPKASDKSIECINWLFWASSTFSVQVKLFGFFFHYCPHHIPYCINRYAAEVTRLLRVLETQLDSHHRHFLLGDQYTIADIATWPWLHSLFNVYSDAIPSKFGGLKDFPRVHEWYGRCIARPASKRAFEVTNFIT